MKAVLCAYAFWQGMSKSIENFVRTCAACMAYKQNCNKKPYITMTEQVTVMVKDQYKYN